LKLVSYMVVCDAEFMNMLIHEYDPLSS
jgi:hypothetical protein